MPSFIVSHLFYTLILTPVRFIPFSGGKGTVFEGGVRVPAFIYGPRSILGNLKSYDGIFHVSDFYPTILNMINETERLGSPYLKNIDGVNQFDALQRQATDYPRRSVHIHR